MENRDSVQEYVAKFPRSKALYEKAVNIFPGGCPHDAWVVKPFPIFMARAKGSHEWDVDGYEYADFFGGHGGLILGHADEALVATVKKGIEHGTHFGTIPDLAVEWAQLIKDLIPSAERVEFTSSGTEANMLAIRLARGSTGRDKIVRFRGQMGGWYDPLTVGGSVPWEIPISAGILPGVSETTMAIPVNEEETLEKALKSNDVALLVCEAAGAFSGVTGIAPTFYKAMRDLTKKYGTLLLFDEVITGFRYSSGGVQKAKGIIPDLTTLGKQVTGMLPGAGAVVGRADVMDLIVQKHAEWNRYKRVPHPGTFNANPLCAAAGIATLKILATGEPQKKASQMARQLCQKLQGVLDRHGIPGCAYGDFSAFHTYIGKCDKQGKCDRIVCLNDNKVRTEALGNSLYINLMLNGVHMPPRGFDGFVSAAHTGEDIAKYEHAFDIALSTMAREGTLKDK